MEPKKNSLSERVAAYYSQLTTVAADLNAVSDELGKSITDIDFALKKLNLGISAWVIIRSWDGEMVDASFWSEELGYAKNSGKWGISIKRVDGNYNCPEDANVESWLFNDAPRSLRLSSIEKIPELLEKLSTVATETTKKLRGKLTDAQAVAAAVKNAADPKLTTARPSFEKILGSSLILPIRPIGNKTPPPAELIGVLTPPPAPGVDSIRQAIDRALVEADHASAAQLLRAGAWTLDGESLRIEVAGMGKKMLALTINVMAEKIIRQELQRLGTTSRFLIVPGETVAASANKAASTAKAGEKL